MRVWGWIISIVLALLYVWIVQSEFTSRLEAINDYLNGIEDLISEIKIHKLRMKTAMIKKGLGLLKKLF